MGNFSSLSLVGGQTKFDDHGFPFFGKIALVQPIGKNEIRLIAKQKAREEFGKNWRRHYIKELHSVLDWDSEYIRTRLRDLTGIQFGNPNPNYTHWDTVTARLGLIPKKLAKSTIKYGMARGYGKSFDPKFVHLLLDKRIIKNWDEFFDLTKLRSIHKYEAMSAGIGHPVLRLLIQKDLIFDLKSLESVWCNPEFGHLFPKKFYADRNFIEAIESKIIKDNVTNISELKDMRIC